MNNYGFSASVQQLETLNNCTRRRHRKCSDDQVGCDGPSEEVEKVTCPVVQVTPNYEGNAEFSSICLLFNECFSPELSSREFSLLE